MRSADVTFDTGIMRRYDREGPRYTSYPSARQFHDRLPPDAYRQAASMSRGARKAADAKRRHDLRYLSRRRRSSPDVTGHLT
jgi:hypothetical protein